MLITFHNTGEIIHFDMVTFNLPHTNLLKHSAILSFSESIYIKILTLQINHDMFCKHIKVPDAIEQSHIYFVMALRKYFDMVTKKLTHIRLGKSKTQKEKKIYRKVS